MSKHDEDITITWYSTSTERSCTLPRHVLLEEAEREQTRAYREECLSVARAICDEASDREQAYDLVHQHVDGHAWIIYTRYHLMVLQHTDHEDAWQDFGELPTDNPLAFMAFAAFRADVEAELEELCAEKFDREENGDA